MGTTGEEMQERNMLYIALKSTVKGPEAGACWDL